MAAKKILFFIAGTMATTDEQSAINAILSSEFDLDIRTNLKPATYGSAPESCDYVAGTVPATHSTKPVWPGAIIGPEQALVNSGDDVLVDFGSGVPAPGLAVANITDGVLTAEFDGTIGTVKDQQSFVKSITVEGIAADYTVTPTVVDGVITTMALVKVV